jgi:hypothetical protein
MTTFLDYLHERLAAGGFPTDDALAAFLPLARQTVAAHRAGLVAPLEGVEQLRVESGRIWFEDALRTAPRTNPSRLQALESPQSRAMEVIGEFRQTTDVTSGQDAIIDLQIGERGAELTCPVYLPGYVSWEHAIGHQDPLTDIYGLGLILASLAGGLDLTQPEQLALFVSRRANPFVLNRNLHPVVAKALVRMTELHRRRRPQDLGTLIHALENYRDQDIDFEFDLARMQALGRDAPPAGAAAVPAPTHRNRLVLSALQQRLFEISRRNRLLHFRPTLQTVNLTWASVPLMLDIATIRPEQLLTWNADIQEAVVAGKPIPLNRYLRFEEAIYLPAALDQIRNEARRDRAEYGFAQLRLAVCFLRWSNLKEKPPERFDSPLVLLPVELTRKKGVRDTYVLEPRGTEAEVNPVLRHYLLQLYNVTLPETVDLADSSLDGLHETLAARIQASEPGVTVEKIDRPRIRIIHARARRRLEQYRQRSRLSGRGVRSFGDLDYSYTAENFHPLGLRLFETHVRPPATRLHAIVEETPRPWGRTPMVPDTTAEVPTVPPPPAEAERSLYTAPEPEPANPYHWEFDLCNVTLGNFRYRKMSLVRDYAGLLENSTASPAFEAVFSADPRPASDAPPALPILADRYPVVPCDPTQTSAVAWAHTGRSYVIQGPPGTGKSQTITNLIADYVLRGQRVLFICQKRAALDVVYHRLRQSGLHPLCCLIHDSQADKKDFILDLKATYEAFLEDRGEETVAQSKRDDVLKGIVRELKPLEHFHDVMTSVPENMAVPVRRLLHRAVELQEHAPTLAPADQEWLPPYALWQAHREPMDRLADILEEIQGNEVFAHHPLRLLSPRVASEARPLEYVTTHLDAADGLLGSLEKELKALGLGPSECDTPEKAQDLTRYAESLRFLAEHGAVRVLRPDSDLAKNYTRLLRAYRRKDQELARAREATTAWTYKLPPEEVKSALEQTRALGDSVFRFLKPVWWRLRRVLHRSYNFRAHQVKPSWTQVLERLDLEYKAAVAVDAVEAEARNALGFNGSLEDFALQLASASKALDGLPEAIQAIHRRLLDTSTADAEVLRLAALGPTAGRLEAELTAFLEDAPGRTFAQLHEDFAHTRGALDGLPDFLSCLAEVARLPVALAVVLRRLPLDRGQLEAAMAERTLGELCRADRAVGRFTSAVLTRHVGRLADAYERWHGANAAAVLARVRQRFLEHVQQTSLPASQLDAAQKEFRQTYTRGRRELEHEFGKTMRYKSIRELVSGDSGLVLADLKPVWLMSPLSVSDTLPLDGRHFDVVIFDEASQVPLEEAVPSVSRAPQVIVVGDEMQLPPTAFFTTRTLGEDEPDDEAPEGGGDLASNSFLNHAGRKLPSTMLGWHYRSRSESLISFSNAAFYQGRLLTVPEETRLTPATGALRTDVGEEPEVGVAGLLERAVSFHFLEHGVYQKRRNPAEAEYIARLVRGLLAQQTGRSIGIVAFSESQQEEILGALQRVAQEDKQFREQLEAEFEREENGQFLGLLVKNLENIQGDERDIMLLSVCYGPGPTGRVLMNFGPINQGGGEKRLNVAFSRARYHMAVVSSMRSDQITNDYNEGARCLKSYLRYAEAVSAGDRAGTQRVLQEMLVLPASAGPGNAPAPDAVVEQLAAALATRGYRVDRNVGQSRFRCDLAVYRDNDRAYRAGILVDTDAFYQQADVLEQEVLKPRLLEAFGWTVVRVLTKDWHDDRAGLLKQLDEVLTAKQNS